MPALGLICIPELRLSSHMLIGSWKGGTRGGLKGGGGGGGGGSRVCVCALRGGRPHAGV